MVHQWQTLFHEQRLSRGRPQPAMPDYEGLARGYGALGAHRLDRGGAGRGLAAAIGAERTFVLDVRVDAAGACYPMIQPGGAAAEQVEWSEAMA